MASFKAKFPVLQELFAKNHRGALCPPPPVGRGLKNIFFVACHKDIQDVLDSGNSNKCFFFVILRVRCQRHSANPQTNAYFWPAFLVFVIYLRLNNTYSILTYVHQFVVFALPSPPESCAAV